MTNTNQDIYLVKWDYMYNPLDCYKLEIQKPKNYVYPIFLRSGEIGLLIDNKIFVWISYKENHNKSKLSYSIREYSTSQDVILLENINSNPLVFNINQLDKRYSFLLDTKTFKQYLL